MELRLVKVKGHVRDMTNLFKQCIDDYFDHSKIIPASNVSFGNEVRELCEQNACGKFGKSWTCPPAVGSLEELHARLKGFNQFIIFYEVYALEDSFDWEGMMNGVKDFQSKIFKLKKQIKEENADFIVLGAGACQVCEVCTYLEQKPCRFPDDAMYSVESFGIDAMKLMKDNGLNYNNGPNTVTYIGGLFYSGDRTQTDER